MATRKTEPSHQEVVDALCCLLDREANLNDVEIKPKAAPKKIQLREVRDCCGCGCSFMYYEDTDTLEQYTKTKAREMVKAKEAVFTEQTRDI